MLYLDRRVMGSGQLVMAPWWVPVTTRRKNWASGPILNKMVLPLQKWIRLIPVLVVILPRFRW